MCEGAGEICCSLGEVDRTQHYEALSYAWGFPTHTREDQTQPESARFICLNGKPFPVTSKLLDALH
jgi:hypothetical protein